DAFAENLNQDVQGTLQRFVVLQAHGDMDNRRVARQLSECVDARIQQVTALSDGLRLLRSTNLRPDLAAMEQPVLILQGDRDTVVPPGAADYLHRSLPRAQLNVI